MWPDWQAGEKFARATHLGEPTLASLVIEKALDGIRADADIEQSPVTSENI